MYSGRMAWLTKQNAHDRYHDEQFNQAESRATPRAHGVACSHVEKNRQFNDLIVSPGLGS